MDEYSKRRLAELKAAAPKHKRKRDNDFAIINLRAAAEAFRAANCLKAFVYVWLVRRARLEGKRTIDAPNGELARYGVSRDVKGRALDDYEAAGMIRVDRRDRKTPRVTLL